MGGSVSARRDGNGRGRRGPRGAGARLNRRVHLAPVIAPVPGCCARRGLERRGGQRCELSRPIPADAVLRVQTLAPSLFTVHPSPSFFILGQCEKVKRTSVIRDAPAHLVRWGDPLLTSQRRMPPCASILPQSPRFKKKRSTRRTHRPGTRRPTAVARLRAAPQPTASRRHLRFPFSGTAIPPILVTGGINDPVWALAEGAKGAHLARGASARRPAGRPRTSSARPPRTRSAARRV